MESEYIKCCPLLEKYEMWKRRQVLKMNSTLLIIPAYNEAENIERVQFNRELSAV